MKKSIALFLTAGGLLAQTPADPPKNAVAGGFMIGGGPSTAFVGVAGAFAPGGIVAGAPYSALTSTQQVQTLADGNRIEQTTTGSVARDSQGRMRREETLPALPGSNGDAPHLITIDDPVAQVHWTLDEQSKTAFKMILPAGRPGANAIFAMPALPALSTTTVARAGVFQAGVPGPTVLKMGVDAGKIEARKADISKTDLGTQPFDNVPAQGTRITNTLPAGEVGNALPIVITTETWFAPSLKVMVMSKSTDPRIGETTYKLTGIQRAEPAASLFEIPADYTVQEQPAGAFTTFKVKGAKDE